VHTQPKQRRHRVRVPFERPVALLVPGSAARAVRGVTIDISSGGVLVETERGVPVGERVLVLAPLGGRLLHLPARTVRVRESAHGPAVVAARFEAADREDVAAITRLVFSEARRQGVGAGAVHPVGARLVSTAGLERPGDVPDGWHSTWSDLRYTWLFLPEDW
jgi:hypothetical protein